jgi:mannose-6-phosphate isomerase-like protein (cupin superfamily)
MIVGVSVRRYLNAWHVAPGPSAHEAYHSNKLGELNMHHLHLSDINTGQGSVSQVLAAVEFKTPWDTLDHISLAPQSEHRWNTKESTQVEYGYLVLDGEVELSAGPHRWPVTGPAVLRTLDPNHSLVNTGSRTAKLLALQVAMVEGSESASSVQHTQVDTIDPERLQWRPAIHGGAGRIATRHIWGPGDFASTWTFLDQAILAPGSSVGYHYHDGMEESFIIVGGTGYVTIEGTSFEVTPGSVTFQGIGQPHGIFNPAEQELNFIRVAVAGRDGAFTTVDMHDDLTSRNP